MGAYEKVCAENKKLYGELEHLSIQIRAYEQANLEIDITELRNKKAGVMSLINGNLEKLQEIWDAKSLVHSNPALKMQRTEPSKLDRKIIDSYYQNPDQTLERIGINFNVKTPAVSTVITKLLKKQFIGY